MAIEAPLAYRVNGAFLPNFLGKRVVVVGKVIKVHPNGKSLELQTSDDRVVTVNFNDALENLITGIVEVHGKGVSKSVVQGESLYEYPESNTGSFDMEQYNECINVMNTLKNAWTDE